MGPGGAAGRVEARASLLHRPAVRTGLGLLALALMVGAAYSPAIRAGFIWDDDKHLVEDPLMTLPDGLSRIWLNPGQGVWNYWPLSRTSFWLERRVWGLDPRGYHVVNILLHLTSATLLWVILREHRVRGSWLIAACFALHPVCVESVAWITERKNTLSCVLYLLSIWSFLRFDVNRRWRWYLLSLGSFALALLSKSSTVMLPVVLILCRLWQRRPWRTADLLPLVPPFLLSLGAAALSVLFERHIIGSVGSTFSLSPLERLVLAGRIATFYLQKIAFPHPLAFNYPRWEIDAGSAAQWMPVVVLAAAAAALWSRRRSWGRAPLLAYGAFLVTLFPVMGFFNVYGMRFSWVADRWCYLALIPMVVITVHGLASLLVRIPSTAARLALPAFVLVSLGVATWSQARSYRDLETLWLETLARNPQSWMALNNLGALHAGRGETVRALARFSEAIETWPSYSIAYANRGAIRLQRGECEAAARDFRKAILWTTRELSGEADRLHGSLGTAHLCLGRVDLAVDELGRAIRLRPDHAEHHARRGAAHLLLGDYGAAITDLTRALEIGPENPLARADLERALRLAAGRSGATSGRGSHAADLPTEASSGGQSPPG